MESPIALYLGPYHSSFLNHMVSMPQWHDVQGVSEPILVDPKFREQFEIAHPTASYEALLQRVPQFFVGTEARLVHVVELLCAEMSAAFRGTGEHLCPCSCQCLHCNMRHIKFNCGLMPGVLVNMSNPYGVGED